MHMDQRAPRPASGDDNTARSMQARSASRVTPAPSATARVGADHDSGSVVFDASAGEYFLIDENSRNGTRINGEPVSPGVPTAVWSGAHVSFGDAVFVFLDPPTLRKLAKLAV